MVMKTWQDSEDLFAFPIIWGHKTISWTVVTTYSSEACDITVDDISVFY